MNDNRVSVPRPLGILAGSLICVAMLLLIGYMTGVANTNLEHAAEVRATKAGEDPLKTTTAFRSKRLKC